LWLDGLGAFPVAAADLPFLHDDALTVAYFGSAEAGCFMAAGLPMPQHHVDLYAEFRMLGNYAAGDARALEQPSLLDAAHYFGINAMDAARKELSRNLIISGASLEGREGEILDYCESDVRLTLAVFARMAAGIDWPRALLRGRYSFAVGRMEWRGVPIDVPTLAKLRTHWGALKLRLIENVDAEYGVYDGATFSLAKFAAFLERCGIPWSHTPSGRLATDSDTFKDAARTYPGLRALHELRSTLSGMRLTSLAVGSDGRNRTLLSPFRSITGRNQPSNSKFIFGPATWMRGLIKPPPGYAVVYLDWSAQELGIAAALSGDARMIADYQSGDPYIQFAKRAGLAPADASKRSHPALRESCKVVCLGVLYGMEVYTLAARLAVPVSEAQAMLEWHHAFYPQFWAWSDGQIAAARLRGFMRAEFGWTLQVSAAAKSRTVSNFPMQANGAEAMRLAAIRATECGLSVAAPVHDAFVLVPPLERLAEEVAAMGAIMEWAGKAVTGGLTIRVDTPDLHRPTPSKLVLPPDRYMDPRGAEMWGRVTALLAQVEACPRAIRSSEQSGLPEQSGSSERIRSSFGLS
jgi:hypothetical protein